MIVKLSYLNEKDKSYGILMKYISLPVNLLRSRKHMVCVEKCKSAKVLKSSKLKNKDIKTFCLLLQHFKWLNNIHIRI